MLRGYAPFSISLCSGHRPCSASIAFSSILSKPIQTVSYSLNKDEPEEVVKFAEKSPLNREINCKVCGSWLVQEHPDCPGMFYASGDYIGADLCYDCMSDHCAQTHCNNCEIGSYPNCKYAYLKKNGGREDE